MSKGRAHSVLAGTGFLGPGSPPVELLVTRDKFPPTHEPSGCRLCLLAHLGLAQDFIFPQECFSENEDDRFCFLMCLSYKS